LKSDWVGAPIFHFSGWNLDWSLINLHFYNESELDLYPFCIIFGWWNFNRDMFNFYFSRMNSKLCLESWSILHFAEHKVWSCYCSSRFGFDWGGHWYDHHELYFEIHIPQHWHFLWSPCFSYTLRTVLFRYSHCFRKCKVH